MSRVRITNIVITIIVLAALAALIVFDDVIEAYLYKIDRADAIEYLKLKGQS